MWHEARKQERRIRGLIIDYRRRAERRQYFYERIQADPTQFIQVHGRRCKIHLDPSVAAAGDGAAIIVPWQGQGDNLIDRFDVRAHLDFIPSVPRNAEGETEPTLEERQCNYERYRILAQNDFLNITEEKFLHQLNLEEQFGANVFTENPPIQGKKKPQKTGAAIGYTYDDVAESTGDIQPFSHLQNVGDSIQAKKLDKESETESESDIDMDVSIDITKIDTIQAHELNACGRNYGMVSNDFYSYLTRDADEADALRIAREEQHEKMLLSGRKSRRERKAQKERRIANRPFSPPSYAAKEDKSEQAEESESRSPSPTDTTEKITYITSFGGEDELHPHSKISINLQKTLPAFGDGASTSTKLLTRSTYADKVKENLHQINAGKEANKRRSWKRSSSESRKRSRSRSRSRNRSRRTRRFYRRSSTSDSSSPRNRRYDRRSRTRSRSISRIYSSRRYKSTRRKSSSRSRYRRHRSTSSNSSSSSHSTSRRIRSSMRRSKYKHASKARSPSRRRSRSPSAKPKDKHKSTPIKPKSPEKQEREKKTVVIVPETTTTVATNVVEAIPVAEPIVHASAASSVVETEVIEPPPPPLKRYYGRKRNKYSQSSESDLEQDETKIESQILPITLETDPTSEKADEYAMGASFPKILDKTKGKYSTVTSNDPSNSNTSESKVTVGSGRLNLRERLKRKMQNLLNKQYKADKKAEIQKTEREKQLQQEREEEMRELSLKLRRRQRKLRHRHGSANSMESTESFDREKCSPTASDDLLKRQSIDRPSDGTTKKQRSSHRDRYNSRSCSRYRSRSRDRSRSRGSSRYRSSRYTKSRSPSRSRRSCSRRRYNISRHRRNRERSSSRHSGVGSRYRRSSSRGDRPSSKSRSKRRIFDREQTPHDRRRYQENISSTPSSIQPVGVSRSRAVISAPPKLKKLVDY